MIEAQWLHPDMHPSTFIAEEMEARGWDRIHLAARMGGEVGMNLLCIDMYFIVGPTQANMRLGQDTAKQFSAAFGISPEYFLNLEKAWRGEL